MKNLIIVLIAIILVGIGAYFLTRPDGELTSTPDPVGTIPTPLPNGSTTEPVVNTPVDDTKTVIGKSVEGRDITAFHFGKGADELVFVGGIHGGYSWNTALVAYELMDYLEATPTAVPENIKVTVIPVFNPDGLNKVVGTAERFTAAQVPASQAATVLGRYNANNVDLNRNFACDWAPISKWQNTDVSGGTMAFSEPEALAFKNYIESKNPNAVVVWYSAAGGVFASECHGGVLAETRTLTNLFAGASGYKPYETFNFYEITGDMVNWLASKKIPAISVLLTDHKNTEWSQNKAGIEAIIKNYAK